jgi:hypothetical protein
MDSIGGGISFGGEASEGGLPSQVGPVEEEGVRGRPLVTLLSDLD